jgi:RNA polymerase sigma factor (sigma-70 family)
MSSASTGEPRTGEPQPLTRSDLAPASSPPPRSSSVAWASATPPPALTGCDEDATPPSGWSLENIRARMARSDSADKAPESAGGITEALYEEHWAFAFQLLPTYGVYGPDQEDVAQTVWKNVHAQIATYDPERVSARAWIAGFVRRSAANYRRALERRPEVPAADPAAGIATPGLNPEQCALLRTLEQAVPDEDQREAFLLRERHGLTIEEIAAVVEVSKGLVESRLERARELLWTWGS